MVAELARGGLPEAAPLRQRFDMAMTKKMGIVRLPSAFWINDPKINPRADHLFWAALILRDRPRVDLALAVLAAEQAERLRGVPPDQGDLTAQARQLLAGLLRQISEERVREGLCRDLAGIVPEWLDNSRCGNEWEGDRGH